jgi:hypothetical protein
LRTRPSDAVDDRRHILGDAVLALTAVALDVVLFSRLIEDESRTSWVTSPPHPGVIVLASLPSVAALMLRRRMPATVSIALAIHAAVLTLILGTRPLLAPLIALYTVSALRSWRVSLVCLAATLAAHGMAVAYEAYSYLDPADRVFSGSLIALVFAVCDCTALGIGRRTALARRRESHLEELRDTMAAAVIRSQAAPDDSTSPRRSRAFVSYRNDDTAHAAGRLGEELERRLGSDRVFIDVNSIDAGADFRVTIAEAVARTAVMLVLVGDRWVRSADGRRRLNEPGDVLRLELEQALHTETRMIPVLVDGAKMPSPADLPPTLRPLTRLNAMTLGARSFRRDVEDIIHRIESLTNGELSDNAGDRGRPA